MKALLTGLALIVPTSALATPVAYFDCQLPSPQGPKVARLAVDEDHNEVIYQLPSEKTTRRLPATFTGSNVTFAVPDGSGEITFSINRLNLSVERFRRIGIERSATSRGTCSATTAP